MIMEDNQKETGASQKDKESEDKSGSEPIKKKSLEDKLSEFSNFR